MAVVVAVSGPRSVIAGSTASLLASAGGGTAPYSYVWSLQTPAGSTTSLSSLTGTGSSILLDAPGLYIISVTVTDAVNASASTNFAVTTAHTDYVKTVTGLQVSTVLINGAVPAVTTPGMPTNVTATAGDGQAVVSFTPGASHNGSVSYTAQSNPGNLTTVGTASPLVVTGLTNGVSYAFTVSATNSAGTATSPASAAVTPVAAVSTNSTAARTYLTSGSAPQVRVTYQTAAVSVTTAQCAWVGSFAAGQSQTAWSVRLDDMTSGTTGMYTRSGSGSTETTTLNTTLTAGHAYKAWVTLTQTDGQSSMAAGTRFVVPSGRVVYLEDYGATGDGVHNDGTDYAASIYSGPFTAALLDLHYGDVLRSKNPGFVLSGISASGTTLNVSSGVLTQSHVGKPVIVYGGGSNSYGSPSALHTSITAVAGNGKSATLAASVASSLSDANVLVAYPTYRIGHIDVDSNHGPGGYTIDLTGCLATSTDPDHAGFNVRLPDVTLKNIHYQHLNVSKRGTGLNNNDGTFFVTGTATVGGRFIGCYSETSQDAAYLFYSGPSDHHVVDCIDDHSYADAFHTTGGAHDIQFIRPTAYYPGDDGFANVGYLNDGAAGQPYNITWESPTLHAQDWGRGLSAIGCHDILYTDVTLDGTADAAVYLGQEGGATMDTHRVQIRRGAITSPNYRRGLKPLTQGPNPSGTVNNRPWLLLLSGQSNSQQSDFRLEGLNCSDGRYIQIIRYGSGTYKDASITVITTAMTGTVNAGGSWLDDSTWPLHIDMRGISVPAGSAAAAAPGASGTNGGS